MNLWFDRLVEWNCQDLGNGERNWFGNIQKLSLDATEICGAY